MKDDNIFFNNGKFVKQYFLNFPDGKTLHAWIFLTNTSKLQYGHRMKHKDGRKEFYSSVEERDFFDLPELEHKVTMSLNMVALQSNAKMRVLEFSSNVDLEEQMKTMDDIGAEGSHDIIDLQKRESNMKYLESLWDKDKIEMDEDISSEEWLLSKIREWELSNREKGRMVEFFGSFFAVDSENNNEVKSDRVFAFGLKKTILNILTEIKKEIKREKEDFINW